MNKEDFLKHPQVAALSPVKRQLIEEFISKSPGLTMDKAMPLLVQMNARMKALGVTFTKQETNLMFELLSSDMKPADKAKFDTIRKMLAR